MWWNICHSPARCPCVSGDPMGSGDCVRREGPMRPGETDHPAVRFIAKHPNRRKKMALAGSMQNLASRPCPLSQARLAAVILSSFRRQQAVAVTLYFAAIDEGGVHLHPQPPVTVFSGVLFWAADPVFAAWYAATKVGPRFRGGVGPTPPHNPSFTTRAKSSSTALTRESQHTRKHSVELYVLYPPTNLAREIESRAAPWFGQQRRGPLLSQQWRQHRCLS